jgi:putative tricarboxylic transport membrane protein
MRILVKNQKDWFAGLIFVAFGGVFAWGATAYRMGVKSKMGPGYFPFVLGCLLAFLGLVLVVRSLAFAAAGTEVERIHFKPMTLILGAIAAFALLLNAGGLAVALLALVVISSLAGEKFDWKEAALVAAVLIVSSWVLFVRGLGLQFPMWPAFLGR